MEGGAIGDNFERDTPMDHLCHAWTLAHNILKSHTYAHILDTQTC
jgi:hypothetical protein